MDNAHHRRSIGQVQRDPTAADVSNPRHQLAKRRSEVGPIRSSVSLKLACGSVELPAAVQAAGAEIADAVAEARRPAAPLP